MNPFTLEHKHVLITGASSGIGRQCAISCSQQGATITLVGRNMVRLEETFHQLHGKNHHIISEDISNLEVIDEIVKESVEKNGKLNGFIHAAGIEKTLPLRMHKPEIFKDIFEVNVLAAFEFVRIISQKKYVCPDNNSFIFISSIMGSVGNNGLVGYSASKGALISSTKSLALELSKKQIRVNCISPGHIGGTAMSHNKEDSLPLDAVNEIKRAHPLGLGETEDIANSAIFLLSSASKWITGTNLIVDGGYSAK